MTTGQSAVVFVHGLFSSSRTWVPFRDLIASDPDLAHVTVLDFEYPSPKFNLSPLKRIPNFDVLADSLRTYLDTEAAEYSDVVLASHSQGGLIVQRYMARMVTGAHGLDLQRIRRVVMFACPNSGSEIFLLARRRAWFWKHPQERELRPVNDAVSTAQQVVVNRIVHAQQIASDQCPVSIHAYAGDRDNIVTPTSAKGVFPDTGVLPGDHFSIIQPDSARHRAYLALKHHLIAALHPRQTHADVPAGLPSSPDAVEASDLIHHECSPTNGRVHDPATSPSESAVIARWNPSTRTMEFILTPQTALEWIKELGRAPTDGWRRRSQRPRLVRVEHGSLGAV
ncbi:esterase/lipase family protein [Amycolatopsis sp. WGS_07]|uniref:esterase/lipase family protein n=1 Tax=Amycolatopsis sp. WGS_07 TaxID=3076764 RepID=UPI003873B133